MKTISKIIAASLLVVLTGCSVMQALAFKDCKYSYSRMTDVNFMGLTSNEMASFAGATRLAAGLLGNAPAPLNFTIHVNVYNPNQTTASMESLYYKVSLDSVEVAEGNMPESFTVVGGTTADLPLNLSVDVKNLLQTDKRIVMTRAIKNMMGVGSEPTQVTLLLKPTFRMGGALVASPVFIPVNFTYSGKKSANTTTGTAGSTGSSTKTSANTTTAK